jgi:methylated-DNA-[protein]-cysteine S-methyltransferase
MHTPQALLSDSQPIDPFHCYRAFQNKEGHLDAPRPTTSLAGKAMNTYTTRTASPLGELTLACSDRGLCGVWFEGQRHGPEAQVIQGWQPAPDHPLLQATAAQLQDYFAGRRTVFDLPLDLSHGTTFQQAVWQALLDIEAGSYQSYGQLASHLNNPQAVRAVGAAVGRNPVSIIVPCHRVLGSTGQLTGYAGGLERKRALLQLEGHPLS